jgi:soluble lytic murein transglycosylase-like protein
MKFLEQIQSHERRIVARIPTIFGAFFIMMITLAGAGGANAQTTDKGTPPTIESVPTTEAKSEDPAAVYSDSLKKLATLYEQQAQKLSDENEKLKQLFTDGLISRVELEKSDKSLAEARALFDSTEKKITENSLKPAIVAAAPALASNVSSTNWTTGNGNTDNLIRFYGARNSVDPYLIFCLMHQESGFASRVTSPKGAQGLMQLMPGTAARYGVTNSFDAAQNISAGARYLKDLLQMFNGRLDLALAGYNAGEGAVIKYGYQIPPYSETQNYVRLITYRYNQKPAPSKKS